MPLARALHGDDAQQLAGHVDPDPLLLRIQQMGDPSQILNLEMKYSLRCLYTMDRRMQVSRESCRTHENGSSARAVQIA
jgi:hypothetical protein